MARKFNREPQNPTAAVASAPSWLVSHMVTHMLQRSVGRRSRHGARLYARDGANWPELVQQVFSLLRVGVAPGEVADRLREPRSAAVGRWRRALGGGSVAGLQRSAVVDEGVEVRADSPLDPEQPNKRLPLLRQRGQKKGFRVDDLESVFRGNCQETCQSPCHCFLLGWTAPSLLLILLAMI